MIIKEIKKSSKEALKIKVSLKGIKIKSLLLYSYFLVVKALKPLIKRLESIIIIVS